MIDCQFLHFSLNIEPKPIIKQLGKLLFLAIPYFTFHIFCAFCITKSRTIILINPIRLRFAESFQVSTNAKAKYEMHRMHGGESYFWKTVRGEKELADRIAESGFKSEPFVCSQTCSGNRVTKAIITGKFDFPSIRRKYYISRRRSNSVLASRE